MFIEIYLPKEVQANQKSIFFGLSLRQLLFSLARYVGGDFPVTGYEIRCKDAIMSETTNRNRRFHVMKRINCSVQF
jgi:hypothetical protein